MASSKRQEVPEISPLDDTGILQQYFPLKPPLVACLVRHLNRDMEEVITPPSIEQCVVELQSYFQPWIDAIRVVDRCLNGSRLQLQFGKAMDINSGASSSLLNVYIYAVDQVYSRPRLLAHVAREWRTLLEKSNREGSCLVMLYHQDLVDAAGVSARRASGMESGNAVKKLDQRKADAAAAALEPYFEELKALKFAPHQMCTYLPNEAPIRVVERLRVAYGERAQQLSSVFDQVRRQRQPKSIDSGALDAKPLRKSWREGYDLALHFLQFGVVSEAMAVFSRMFHLYYCRSEDYSFVTKSGTMEQLGKMPNMFDPSETPLGSDGYPLVFDDSAELAEGLCFIAASEITCALLLGRHEAAFTRYKSLLQVVWEKFTDEATFKITDARALFFLLRCALSAMQLNWGFGNVSGSNIGMLASPIRWDVRAHPSIVVQRMQSQHASASSPDDPSLSSDLDYRVSIASPKWNWGRLATPMQHVQDAEERLKEEASHVAVSTERLEELCDVLGVTWMSGVNWMHRLCAKLSTDAQGFLVDLGEILGYRETGEVVVRAEPETAAAAAVFGMPELALVSAFTSLYRTLIEVAALGFGLVNSRHLEHAFFYKLALSYRVESPAVTAQLCHHRLIPFFLANGWLQLQTIVHRLYVESMDLVIQGREENGEVPLTNAETIALKESLLHIIGALGERGDLQWELGLLCGTRSPAKCWWNRLKRIDREWSWRRSDIEKVVEEKERKVENEDDAPYYSLSILLKDTRVFCLHCDSLEEGSPEWSGNPASVFAASGGLRVNLGEKVLLCFEATCPVNLLEHEAEEPQRGGPPYTLTATLVSKKSWGDSNEATHVVDVSEKLSSSYDEEKLQLRWTWEFQPCRAGEYYLRCITLTVAETKLVYLHCEATARSPGRNTSNISVGSSFIGDSGMIGPPPCLISVPEPDIGIKLRVVPPEEEHCFRDTLTFFTLHVDVERPLYFPCGGADRDEKAVGDVGCKYCRMEAPNLLNSILTEAANPTSVGGGGGSGTSASPSIFNFANAPWDFRRSIAEITSPLDPSTLAFICVDRPGRGDLCGFSKTIQLFTHSLSGIQKGARVHSNMHDAFISDGKAKFISDVITFKDDTTGVSTSIPFDEEFVMSRLPPLVCERRVDDRATQEGSAYNKDAESQKLTSMRLEGSILPPLRYQTCFRIRLNESGEKIENCGGLPEATSLQCLLPVLPVFMSTVGGCSKVSLCCRRNMESCSTSVLVPFQLSPAFKVQYSFKCFQGRVYCLVQAENILNRTSLWLRGALLELMDSKRYYELSRVSSTHKRLMMREWKPHEKVHFFFELMPKPESHSHEEEVLHSVRLQLLYSDWSVAEGCKPVEDHILRSITPSSVATSEDGVNPNRSDGSNDILTPIDDSLHPLSGDSFGSSVSGALVEPIRRHPRIRYDTAQLEELCATCNTFNGPVGTFTSKHSCLFNVNIFVDTHHPANQGIHVTPVSVSAGDSAISCIGGGGGGSAWKQSSVVGRVEEGPKSMRGLSVDLPGGFLFSVGEPILFSVILEPLAHNWPEDCACEEEFLIAFKADAAAWFVVGRQWMRRTLSIMDEETLYFTAVPVPLSPSPTERNEDAFRRPQSQRQLWWDVATPTVEIYWTSRDKATGGDTCASGAVVPIEVVQFRTFMRIQH